MKMTFRWFGENDTIPLSYIRQIPGISGIVSAVYDVPVGEVWPQKSIDLIKKVAAVHGLEFEVVESVPVHEEIKLGGSRRDALIDNYCETIRRLGKAGVRVVCYNFMPVFDWMRSTLERELLDGSMTLAYDHASIISLDPAFSDFSLPGWNESYSREELNTLLEKFAVISNEELWDHLEYFLKKIIPVSKEVGVMMAIHPDDPPWSIFGLPRIITGIESYDRLQSIVSSPENGITLCLGSLGADPNNKILDVIAKHSNLIHFVHARNIKWTGSKGFEESAHPTEFGDLDMYAILRELHDSGFVGYVRPDHGRMIWGETGRPGYGLYDRALGAMYLSGLWEAIARGGV